MTPFYTAAEETWKIPLMKGLYPDMLTPSTGMTLRRWWEVIDRTTGEVVPTPDWTYEEAAGEVVSKSVPFHDYTVSFLAYIMWDPVHMYNAVVNEWKDVEHQITFDVRQPKTHEYTMKRLRKFIEEHPYVNVLRFTTFFHQFTLVFDELAREKYVEWYGYSASVAPIFWSSSKRKQATNSGLNSSLIRAITITSTVFLPKNTRISRPSSAERSPRLPGKWWISAMNAAGRR